MTNPIIQEQLDDIERVIKEQEDMTEKEERIEISKYDLNNKEWNGDIPIDIHKVYTRQEAIERMAKAMIDMAFTGNYSRFEDTCIVEDAIPYAEAALDALLGKEDSK